MSSAGLITDYALIEAMLARRASDCGVGPKVFGVVQHGPGDYEVCMEALLPEHGWRALEQWHEHTDRKKFREAAALFSEKWTNCGIHAQNRNEWHSGNIFYDGELRILRIDYDPEEGNCWLEGLTQPFPMPDAVALKTSQQLVDWLMKRYDQVHEAPATPPPAFTDNVVFDARGTVCKRVTARRPVVETSDFAQPHSLWSLPR